MSSAEYTGNQPNNFEKGSHPIPVQPSNADGQNKSLSDQRISMEAADSVSFSGNAKNLALSQNSFLKRYNRIFQNKDLTQTRKIDNAKKKSSTLNWILGLGGSLVLIGFGAGISHHQKWIDFGKIGKQIKNFLGFGKSTSHSPQSSTGNVTPSSPQRPNPTSKEPKKTFYEDKKASPLLEKVFAEHKTGQDVTDEELLKQLIRDCDDVNGVDNQGRTALNLFSRRNYPPAILECLLDKGADATKLSQNGFSPLYRAASHSLEKSRALVEKGALKINYPDGEHPIFSSIHSDQSEISQYLLKNGTSKDILDEDESSLLHFASSSKKVTPATIQVLLDAGIKVDIKGKDDLTPLLVSKNKTVADYLIQKGADTQHVSATGKTLFHTYAEIGTEKDLDDLLQKGFDLNARADGKTALSFAAENKKPEMAKFLIQKGIQYTDQDLVAIASKGDTETFKLLMQDQTRFQKVMKEAQDSKALQPIWYQAVERALEAKDSKRQEAMSFIDECLVPNRHFLTIDAYHGSSTDEGCRTALFDAITKNDNELIELLLQNGANANKKNSVMASAKYMNHTPLYVAVSKKNIQACKLLLQHQADSNTVVGEWNGSGTALSKAIEQESQELLNMLLQEGKIKDLTIGTSRNGAEGTHLSSPLYMAVKAGKPDFVDALLQAGANPNNGERLQTLKRGPSGSPIVNDGVYEHIITPTSSPLDKALEMLANSKTDPERKTYQQMVDRLQTKQS